MARVPDSVASMARELGALHHENNMLKARLALKDALIADLSRIYGPNASERLYKAPRAPIPRGGHA